MPSNSITRRAEGRGFSDNTPSAAPAFNLENVSRELGRTDSETASAIVHGLEDLHLRGLAVLAPAAPYLGAGEWPAGQRTTPPSPATAPTPTPV